MGRAAAKRRPGQGSVKTKKRPEAQSAGESYAQQLVEAGLGTPLSAASVERALEAARVPLNGTRKNVIPHGEKAIRGAVVGLYVYADTIGVSSFSRRCPWLTRLLVAFCRQECPGFDFTSIQVNVNYAARPHVDRNNLGASFIVGLGDYAGGKLWIHDESGGAIAHTLDEDIPQEPTYKKGETYMGREADIRGQWLQFNGNRLHLTRPFSGTRYSLVYFTCDRYAEAPTPIRSELQRMGFHFQWQSRDLQKMLVAKRYERHRIRELFAKDRNSMHMGVVPQLVDADPVQYEQKNPKLAGSNAHARYEEYRRARTIGEAVELGASAIDLVFDYNKGFLRVVGLHTKPTDWDFEVHDIARCSARELQAKTALDSDGQSQGLVKVRIREMNAKHKGLDVPRKVLAQLAASVKSLRPIDEQRWAAEGSPTASVPLAALRVLLHWAATGQLRFEQHLRRHIRDALATWGKTDLALRVDKHALPNQALLALPANASLPELASQRKLRAGAMEKAKALLGFKRGLLGKRKRASRPTSARPDVKPCSSQAPAPARRNRAGGPGKVLPGKGPQVGRLQRKAAQGGRLPGKRPQEDKIEYLQANPKTAGSAAHARYELYKKARKLQEATVLGARKVDVAYDFKKGYLKRCCRGCTRV